MSLPFNSRAAHQATSGFDGDAIAQYMRTDFITLQEHLSVHEAARTLYLPAGQ